MSVLDAIKKKSYHHHHHQVLENYRFELTAQHVSLIIITTLVLKCSFFTRI